MGSVTPLPLAPTMYKVSSALAVRAGLLPNTMVMEKEDVWIWMSVCHPQHVLNRHPALTCQGLTTVPVQNTAQCVE